MRKRPILRPSEPIAIKGVLVQRRPQLPHPYGVWMQLSEAGIKRVNDRLADHSINMQAVRVLFAMMAECDNQNRLHMGNKDLALQLDMDQSNVSKAMRALIETGFVERPVTSRGFYRMNPEFMWRGSAIVLRRMLEERRRAA